MVDGFNKGEPTVNLGANSEFLFKLFDQINILVSLVNFKHLVVDLLVFVANSLYMLQVVKSSSVMLTI